MRYNNGEGVLNRDDEKYLDNYDESLGEGLHKDTVANTDVKRQVKRSELPAGIRSRTVYGRKGQ